MPLNQHNAMYINPLYALGISAVSGVLEVTVFHSIDTVSRRIQVSEQPIYKFDMKFTENIRRLECILLRDSNQGLSSAFSSLYRGYFFSVAYKVIQRTYQFGGQPIVRAQLETKTGAHLRTYLGEKAGSTATEAMAGAVMGFAEVSLLPIDRLKIKLQTQSELWRLGIFKSLAGEWPHYFRGAGITLARNIPGSSLLFGVSSAMREHVFHAKSFKEATLTQTAISSLIGAMASIIFTSPMDVVRTRVLSGKTVSAVSMFRKIAKEEGGQAFFKGITTKIGSAGPKLAFAMTTAQTLYRYLT